MSKPSSRNKQPRAGKRDVKKKLIPLLTLLLVIAITFGIFYFYQRYPGRVEALKAYGYLGAFLISLIFNATLILPGGNILILSILGATSPSPTLVGLAGGAGAAIGEITGYMTGYSGLAIVGKGKTYVRVEYWMRRWGVITIFVLSVLPLFFDLVGIAAGILRFPLWKFLLICWLGRSLLYISVALGAGVTLPWLAPLLNFH